MKHLVLMCGLPAAGKSTIVTEYVSDGYSKLSRDEVGGALNSGLMKTHLDNWMRMGKEKIILDNTYTTVESRKMVIEAGKSNGYKVTGIYLNTSAEDSMYNAVTRMINRHGKLFMNSDDYSASKDPNMFPIAAIYKSKKTFEKPTTSEGFDDIKEIKFKRKSNGYSNKAVIFDYDGTLRETISGNIYPADPSDIRIIPGRSEMIAKLKREGYIILGVSNQSGVSKGFLTHEMADKCFKKTNELLGHDIDYRFCLHSVPPITCYCRKPGPGFGVEFIEKYKLDPSQCIMVGDLKTDETFAKRCGFKYVHANLFFKDVVQDKV